MNPEKMLKGKRVLIVDDEPDVLELLTELLDMCKVDAASSIEQAKELLENNYYHTAVLDIMGVEGYELLEIANRRKIPALISLFHRLAVLFHQFFALSQSLLIEHFMSSYQFFLNAYWLKSCNPLNMR